MNHQNGLSYFDYKEKIDTDNNIEFVIPSEVLVNSRAQIKIIFNAEKEYPERTYFRFIIPYGWEPIDLKNDFSTVRSSVKGAVKTTNSQIEFLYILKEPLKKGDFIEFNYNQSKIKHTASQIAYFDELECALDIKFPKDKLFTRIGKKKIKMISDKASFFIVKLLTIYHGTPVDIQIIALDEFGNRDYSFNDEIKIEGDKCLTFLIVQN